MLSKLTRDQYGKTASYLLTYLLITAVRVTVTCYHCQQLSKEHNNNPFTHNDVALNFALVNFVEHSDVNSAILRRMVRIVSSATLCAVFGTSCNSMPVVKVRGTRGLRPLLHFLAVCTLLVTL